LRHPALVVIQNDYLGHLISTVQEEGLKYPAGARLPTLFNARLISSVSGSRGIARVLFASGAPNTAKPRTRSAMARAATQSTTSHQTFDPMLPPGCQATRAYAPPRLRRAEHNAGVARNNTQQEVKKTAR